MSNKPIAYGFYPLHKEIERFRAHINVPRVSRRIMANIKDWNQICSAMDLLGDNLYAIDDYVNQNWPKSEGVLYLLIYGVLQALILQQDAVEHIAAVCSPLPYVLHPKLKAIRDLRNSSSGHPSQRGGKKKTGEDTRTSHFITRISLEHGHYQLMSSKRNSRGYIFKEVDLFKAIKTQQDIIRAKLKKITDELVKRETDHKERFMHLKLAETLSLFSDTYTISKMFEAIDHVEIRFQAKSHVDSLLEALSNFSDELTKRDEMSPEWKEEIGYLEYPLRKLLVFFSATKARAINKKDARIFTAYVEFSAKRLIGMAEEVDQDYAK